jgi:peptidoglycan/xylan/chitin deacetylase (PgdA/CDA1 family)
MRDVLVLCYHGASDTWPAEIAVSPSNLQAQLERLVRSGYRGATFSDAVTAAPFERTLAVTFDDAYSSVLELAFPILDALGLPGTVFAVTDFADSGRSLTWDGISNWTEGSHADELRGLSWTELRDLDAAGWEIGSHTRTHPWLTRLGDEALLDELVESRAACERALGRPCRSIAYPYGDVDQRVVAAAGQAGYLTGGALRRHLESTPSALDWPRIGVYRGDSLARFGVKTSVAVRRLRSVSLSRRPKSG